MRRFRARDLGLHVGSKAVHHSREQITRLPPPGGVPLDLSKFKIDPDYDPDPLPHSPIQRRRSSSSDERQFPRYDQYPTLDASRIAFSSSGVTQQRQQATNRSAREQERARLKEYFMNQMTLEIRRRGLHLDSTAEAEAEGGDSLPRRPPSPGVSPISSHARQRNRSVSEFEDKSMPQLRSLIPDSIETDMSFEDDVPDESQEEEGERRRSSSSFGGVSVPQPIPATSPVHSPSRGLRSPARTLGPFRSQKVGIAANSDEWHSRSFHVLRSNHRSLNKETVRTVLKRIRTPERHSFAAPSVQAPGSGSGLVDDLDSDRGLSSSQVLMSLRYEEDKLRRMWLKERDREGEVPPMRYRPPSWTRNRRKPEKKPPWKPPKGHSHFFDQDLHAASFIQ